MVHWTSITNITAQGCCKLTWLAMQTDQIITQATVFDLLGQGGKRTSSPSLPLQPYNPAATSVVRSMMPASRNPLFPLLMASDNHTLPLDPVTHPRPLGSSGVILLFLHPSLLSYIIFSVLCVTSKSWKGWKENTCSLTFLFVTQITNFVCFII